ncbi:venom serine protease 34-like isoform X2 [Leptidea sinapis]|uniref:venom serine protease 34-like isoform X1 n=1 Tax=Leptidea sinapis TaxID=189913 RepID=UPI0021448EBF|nr:venom serine protease 34-like isoform X1 [Leptidea sinapis]XP_050667833.1 venom serine protease 34-like isoform X2 [Leptidea sinapis]
MIFRSYILAFLFIYALAQNPNCDYSQNVQVGSTYYVYSPNYPNKYPAGVQCRWIATCPTGYNCRLDCQLNIPQSSGCTMDRLLISKNGDPQLAGAEPYCGSGTLTAISTGQKISIGLITSYYSSGGTFLCTLTAQRSSTPNTCSCGIRKMRRIVGGTDASPNEFPMMAGLVEYEGQASIICGGVIISNRYVLTAAHCLLDRNYNNLAIIVGEHDTSTGAETPGTRAYRLSQFLPHPMFNKNTYDYDIAILKTAQQMEFNEYVSAACLPFKFANYDFANQKVIILGWGTLFIGGPRPNVLQKVEVNVISQPSCQRSVRTLTSRQMCTFTPGKDACQYDSGGPLLYTDPQTGLLFSTGLVSFGQSCASADQPGVNTRITNLLNWIVRSAPADYCVK